MPESYEEMQKDFDNADEEVKNDQRHQQEEPEPQLVRQQANNGAEELYDSKEWEICSEHEPEVANVAVPSFFEAKQSILKPLEKKYVFPNEEPNQN